MVDQHSQLYRKNGDAVTRAIVGETLLVPIRGRLADLQQIFSLNPAGAHVWELIDGSRDAYALGAEIAAVFDVDRGEAAVDAQDFLDRLLEAGLVSVVEDPGPSGPVAASGLLDGAGRE